MNKISLKDKIQ